MDTEQFLRKYFGLVGEFYTDEFRRYIATDPEYNNFEGEIWTKETQKAWERAIDMAEDLERMGAIDNETKWNIIHTFCDNG